MSSAARSPRAASGWALANSLASMLASFAGFVLVANLVGTDRLGLLALVGAALFPLRFAELGISGAVTRYVGAYHGPAPRTHFWQVTRLGGAIVLAAFCLLLLACAIVSPPLLKTTIAAPDLAAARGLVPVLVLATFTQLAAGTVMAGLLGLQRFRLVYVAGTITALVQLALVGPLVVVFGVAGMVLAQVAAQAGLLVIYLAALLRLAADEAPDGHTFERGAFIRFAAQFSANSLLASLLEPVAKLVLGASASLSVMGLFEVMWRIYVQMRTLLVAPLNPLGVGMIRQWQAEPRAVEGTVRSMAVFTVLCAVGMIAAAPAVHFAFGLVTPALGAGSILVTAAVSLAIAAAFVSVPSHFLTMAANDVRPIIAATLTNLAIQLIAGTLAGRLLGWEAVFAAFVTANALASLVLMLGASRASGISVWIAPRDWRSALRDMAAILRGASATRGDSA